MCLFYYHQLPILQSLFIANMLKIYFYTNIALIITQATLSPCGLYNIYWPRLQPEVVSTINVYIITYGSGTYITPNSSVHSILVRAVYTRIIYFTKIQCNQSGTDWNSEVERVGCASYIVTSFLTQRPSTAANQQRLFYSNSLTWLLKLQQGVRL